MSSPTWVTTKAILLQSLRFIYSIAFLTAYYQNEGLMGEHGLLPAHVYWSQLQQRHVDAAMWQKILNYPSIFWCFDLNDDNMRLLNISGLTLSVLLILRQGESMLVMGVLWILYFSIVTCAGGTSFYSYGWESLLLETGFLAVFLCNNLIVPSTSLSQSQPSHLQTKSRPPSPVILWLFRWLCFRISMGAGLIKIRGDSCWTQKTCLLYHFETQPIPSPTSFFFHFLPPTVLQHAVDLDLFVQVYTSWMVLLPTHIPSLPRVSKLCLMVVRISGIIQAAFMLNIIVSGNLGFLPHLTIVPALACLDDACWPRWMQAGSHENKTMVKGKQQIPTKLWQWLNPRQLLNLAYALLVLFLSWPVVTNLLQLDGSRQQMNASFDSFRLVNTYGAFGSVGKQRYEPIVSIAYDSNTDDTAVTQDSLDWIELEFPNKPGSIYRRPCFCEPYHYRLDWNIWFIGFKPHHSYLNRRETWLYALLQKLMAENETDRPWLDLLDVATAELLRAHHSKGKVPRYAKVDMYHYQMSAPLWQLLPQYVWAQSQNTRLHWWNRTYEESLVPAVTLGDGQRLMRAPI